MTVENMREAITGKYTDSKWAAKVKTMNDDQVMAIYFRMSQAGMFKPKIKVAISNGDFGPRKTVFYCHDCLQTWTSDNPNETECRFCSSCDITNKPPIERIAKK